MIKLPKENRKKVFLLSNSQEESSELMDEQLISARISSDKHTLSVIMTMKAQG
jgi:hypothetical protein